MQIIDKANYHLPGTVRKILLIQLGDIGDVVWTTPGIWAVKNSIPGSQVSVLVKESYGGLLEADPAIERIFEVRRYSGNIFRQAVRQLSFLKDLRAQHFDLVIDLRLGDRGAFLSRASGAPIRMTLHHPPSVPFWREYFFSHGIVPSDLPPVRGAAEQSLRILRRLGIDSENMVPRLWVSDSVRSRVQEILINEKMDGVKHWVTINPFSRWPYKEWDDHKWIEIINWLQQDFAIPAVIIGSPAERPRAEALISKCEARAFNLAGKTTLAELAGVLSLSRLHIGVDSAAPHIAAATGVPTITIFGPTSWRDWAPVGQDHRVILPDMDCVPCHQKGCNNSGHSRCLDALNTGDVRNVIRASINSFSLKVSS
jgi:predicted lipopolysaccharide heptosyltransferase III